MTAVDALLILWRDRINLLQIAAGVSFHASPSFLPSPPRVRKKATAPAATAIAAMPAINGKFDFFAAGATVIIPEDYETGLQLGGAALKTIGINENHINSIKAQFRLGNYLAIKQEDNTENEENE